MQFIFWTIVVLSSVWVYSDARRIGVAKGQVTGLANMNPIMWLLGCLLLWVITFPLYLSKRAEFKRINGKVGSNFGANLIGALSIFVVFGLFVLSYSGLLRLSTPELENSVQLSIVEKFASDPSLTAVEVKSVRLTQQDGDIYRGSVDLVNDGAAESVPIEVNYDGRQIRWEIKP